MTGSFERIYDPDQGGARFKMRADAEKSLKLARKMLNCARKEAPIEIVSAAFGIAVHAMRMMTPDLPTVLDNVDKLAADMKDRLREKLEN